MWPEFKAWADDHLGQGYSLACADGDLLDKVTAWSFKAFMAGVSNKDAEAAALRKDAARYRFLRESIDFAVSAPPPTNPWSRDTRDWVELQDADAMDAAIDAAMAKDAK